MRDFPIATAASDVADDLAFTHAYLLASPRAAVHAPALAALVARLDAIDAERRTLRRQATAATATLLLYSESLGKSGG